MENNKNLKDIISKIEADQKEFVVDSVYAKEPFLYFSMIPRNAKRVFSDFCIKYDMDTRSTEGCLIFEEFNTADEMLKSQIYSRSK